MHAPPPRCSTSPVTLKTRSPPPLKPVLQKLFFKNLSPCKISRAKFAKSSVHPRTKGCVWDGRLGCPTRHSEAFQPGERRWAAPRFNAAIGRAQNFSHNHPAAPPHPNPIVSSPESIPVHPSSVQLDSGGNHGSRTTAPAL